MHICSTSRDRVIVIAFFCLLLSIAIDIVIHERGKFSPGQKISIKGEGLSGEIVKCIDNEVCYVVKISDGLVTKNLVYPASQLSLGSSP